MHLKHVWHRFLMKEYEAEHPISISTNHILIFYAPLRKRFGYTYTLQMSINSRMLHNLVLELRSQQIYSFLLFFNSPCQFFPDSIVDHNSS